MPTHAVIWIDHNEARVFHLEQSGAEKTTLTPKHHVHKHPKGRGEPREHPEEAKRFFAEVGKAVADVDAILILGPSSGKLELFRYLHDHDRRVEQKVVGIETVDHPTDGQIVAMARLAFKASDRMG